MEREYRIFVHLQGDMLYQLCSVSLPEQAAEVVRILVGAEKTEYTKVTIEIGACLDNGSDGQRR